jgi:hypothetical protein
MTSRNEREQIEAFLRAHGLIPEDYSGRVVVTAKTSEGSDSVAINV